MRVVMSGASGNSTKRLPLSGPDAFWAGGLPAKLLNHFVFLFVPLSILCSLLSSAHSRSLANFGTAPELHEAERVLRTPGGG